MLYRVLTGLILLVLSGPVCLQAQRGDSRDTPGAGQVDPIPMDKVPPQPVLSPEEALKAFKLQPGFHIELVASEPLIHDPIAMTFAPDGRIWVVEMSAYMPNVDGIGEDKPIGKIVILDSSHHDGHFDRRTVFVDHLVLPRAVALIRDGVLIGEPPHLWFYPIIDGSKPGKRTEIAKDYGSDYNPQNTANGLLWDLDNWIYSASYTTRFRNVDGDWQSSPTIRRGEWGLTQDDYGRLIYNSNEDQFRIDLVPSAYLARNPNYRHRVGLNVDPIHDQTVWPIHMTPGVNRGYWKGILRPDGTLAKTTAACGPLIYRGDNFPPEFRGNAFVCEPAGNLVLRDILEETNGVMTGHEAYAKEEFIASTDERFRPVSLYNGPDGAMYLIDFHRGDLEHRLSVTTYLRRQIKARKLEEPLHLGRIFRIVYGSNSPAAETLADLSSVALVPKLASPDGWVQDTAQRLLVERANPAAVPGLKEQALHSTNPIAQIHTAWTMQGMGDLDASTLSSLLASGSGKVRAMAIRLTEDFARGPSNREFFQDLMTLAETDQDPDVQLQLAFTFGQFPATLGQRGLATVARHSAGRPLVREAIITSSYQHELELADHLALETSGDIPGLPDLVQGLAECVVNSRQTNQIAQFLTSASAMPAEEQAAVLRGLATGSKVKKIYFTEQPAALAVLEKNKGNEKLLSRLNTVLTWPGQPGYVPPPVIPPLTATEEKSYMAGRNLFNATCAACHQPTGLGASGVAPPLIDSEWVLGSPQRLARIVLHGVQGPIQAAGVKFDSSMPSWSGFNDEQLSGILTYIRHNWDQGAKPISTATVRNVRKETAAHDGAWTSVELAKIH